MFAKLVFSQLDKLMVIRLIFFLLSMVAGYADISDDKSWHKRVPEKINDLIAIQDRLRNLLPDAQKALVSIEASDGAGSGIIVSEEGLVLTAAHVIGSTGKKCSLDCQTENVCLQ